MSNCIISGLKTNNKYKNQLIHPDVLDLAKDVVAKEKCTLSDALRYISLSLAETTIQRLEAGEEPDAENVLRLN